MDKLPSEILHKVFIQLDLQQRLICLLICRNWWNVLDRCSLFYDINLNEDDDQFDRMMDIFERSLDRAAQVEMLDIKIKPDTRFNKRMLLNIFPNMRVLNVIQGVVSPSSEFSSFPTHIDMTHTKSKIEFLSDTNHCELVSQMLYSNLGNRLEALTLNFNKVPDTSAVISQLKDLPVLKRLTLRNPKIKLYDIEAIHKSIPSIQDFALEDICLDGGNMPSGIIPATCITKFGFRNGSFQNAKTHAQFYQYMAKKYTGIIDIDYIDEKLSYYYSDERTQIYSNGALDFFKRIGPSQNKLAFYGIPNDVDVFEALDAVGAQIKELYLSTCSCRTLFQYLSQSKQYKHIEKLHLYDTGIDEVDLVESMTTLDTLTIESYGFPPALYLADYLVACPSTLKHLIVRGYYLVVDEFETQLDGIETLDIGTCPLTSELGDIVSTRFPNLVKLKCRGKLTQNLHIALKNPQFQEATFLIGSIMQDRDYKYGFSFKSPSQSETQYFLCGTEEATPVEYEDIEHLPAI
ncbi:hypothetical protein K501DRAFT_302292 [Backusella circina FSU 941]|nr:hypothetical protein K501DRAFT_302292 [Backusella circina FSU 941]